MLSSCRRLSRKEFIFTKHHGQKLSFSHFSLITCSHTTPTLPPPRLGGGGPLGGTEAVPRFSVVTPASLHKHAVVRNRLRRTIYDSVAKINLSLDIIIYPKPSMLKLDHAQICSLLASTLQNLNLPSSGA